MNNQIKIIILFLLIPIYAIGSKKTTGYVYDSDKQPVIGAQVFWDNHTQTTVTDADGYFELEKGAKDHMLHVTYVGYDEVVLHVHNDEKIEINLSDNKELGEVVITKSVRGRITSRIEPLNTEHLGVKELSRAACCSLAESFETNPSVDVAYSDAVTGTKQIQMLGLSGSYIQMLTENFSNFRGPAKAYGLDYVPGPWLEGIQISKGASSVKNGYESISGQVNVDYKKLPTADPLSLNLFAGDDERIEGNVDAAIILNEKLSTGIFAHYSQEKKEHDANDDTFLDMPKRQQLNLMNRWTYRTPNFISQSGVKYVNDMRTSGQTPHTLRHANMATDYNPYRIDTRTNRIEAYTKNGYIMDESKNESIALILSGAYHDQKSKYPESFYNVYATNLNASLFYEKHFTNIHRISTGVNYVWDNYDQAMYIPQLVAGNQPTKEAITGAYAEYTFNLNDKFVLLAGLRGDYSSLHKFFVTPRLHLKYDVSDIIQLRASAGKGYKSVFVLPENNYLLASSRTITIANNLKQEDAWNYGVSTTFRLPVNDEELTLTAEWYYTNFKNKVIMDMDSDPHNISFYNLDGKAYSSSFQVEASYPLFRGFNLLASYRWMDTKETYEGKRMEKPLTSRYKALVTASYETPMRIWQFDFTTQFNGSGRMPTPDPVNPLWDRNFRSYIVMNAQITKFFRNWSVYVGGENLTNFKQKNPIISADNPYGSDFDATMVWGPTIGRKLYVGFRYNIGK